MSTAKIRVRKLGRGKFTKEGTIELTESDLNDFLSRIPRQKNPNKIDAQEFMKYVDGRGEMAMLCELKGSHEEMNVLKKALAKELDMFMGTHDEDDWGFTYILNSFTRGKSVELGHISIQPDC